MDQKILVNALQRAGLNTYDDRGSDPTLRAQNALSGRTHYAEHGTLRFHFARITSARRISMGAFFMLVESCAADYENTRRVFRAVCFDIFGTVVYRPDLDESSKSTQAAKDAFYKFWNEFDQAAYYAEELKSKTLEAQRAETIFNQALKEEKPSLVDSILQNALNEVTLAE
jgi:hypothetical protein